MSVHLTCACTYPYHRYTWPSSYLVNSASQPAAYSALRFIPSGSGLGDGAAAATPAERRLAVPQTQPKLLIVWEEPFDFVDVTSGKAKHVRFKAKVIDTKWCA